MSVIVGKRAIVCAAMSLLAALPVGARAGETSRGGEFLTLGWDARGASLAGAATILIRDERSSYWNPANLTFLAAPRADFGTTNLIEGIESRFSTFCVGAGLTEGRLSPDSAYTWRRFAVALSVSHLGLELSEGSKWGESTLGLSAAYAISNYSSIGFTGRVLKNWTDIEDASAWGISLDFGVTERISKHAWFGVAGKNVLNQIYYSKITEQLDPQWNIAFAYDKLLGLVSLECDAVIKDKELNRFLTGVEYTAANDLFFVSGGIDWRLTEGERAIPSFGFGSSYRVSEIALSFSFDPEEAFGMQTHVSLGLLF